MVTVAVEDAGAFFDCFAACALEGACAIEGAGAGALAWPEAFVATGPFAWPEAFERLCPLCPRELKILPWAWNLRRLMNLHFVKSRSQNNCPGPNHRRAQRQRRPDLGPRPQSAEVRAT